MVSAAAAAHVTLIASGQMPPDRGDLAAQTAAALGNGVPGNRLGGLGSGLAYAGCGTFLALPDRGPNAVPWNAALDNTTAYINRFQTLRMQLSPQPAGSRWPFALTARLHDTTLLWSATPLVYGAGSAPSLSRPGHDYFTARSDGYDPAHASDWPADARLDPESLRLSDDGHTVYIGDEYGPHLYRFDRASGRRLGVIDLPAYLAVAHPAPTWHAEMRDNTSGRVANHGMEGLAISPDGRVLFGAIQGPLIQDGGKHGGYARLLRIDLATGAVNAYAYPLTRTDGTDAKPRYAGISDIIAINGHALLVDERDGGGLGSSRPARVKRIYRVDLGHAQSLHGARGQAALARRALHKHLFVDLVRLLAVRGVDPADVPEKIEGLAFGADVRWHGRVLHTLFASVDNDFLARVRDRRHPHGVANPNRFYVMAFAAGDLPGYRPQQRDVTCQAAP